MRKKEFVSKFQSLSYQGSHPHWVHFVACFFEGIPSQLLDNSKDHTLLEKVNRAWEFYQKPFKTPLALGYHYDKKRKKLSLNLLQKDRPFILETVKNALSHHHLEVDNLFHPIISAKRDPNGALLAISLKKNHLEKNEENLLFENESLISCEIDWHDEKDKIRPFIQDLQWRMELVALTVDDWPKMRQSLHHMIPKKQHPEYDYFEWLLHDNFLFLGMRSFDLSLKKKVRPLPTPTNSLGVFKDSHLAKHKHFKPTSFHPVKKSYMFHITKTHFRSPINRSARIDMIEVVNTETHIKHQIIGLFTRRSYHESNFKIPLIKAKAEHIFSAFGLRRNWHDGKSLIQSLEAIPHDEYWHFSENTIEDLCSKVMHFHEFSLPTFIAEHSEDKSSLTVIVFMGKERYSVDLKKTMGHLLESHLKGTLTSTHAIVDDAPFARCIYVLSNLESPKYAPGLQEKLELLSLTWNEKRHRLFMDNHGKDIFSNAFDAAYQKDFTPEQALFDATLCSKLTDALPFQISFSQSEEVFEETFKSHLQIRLMSDQKPVVLSKLMLILQHFGITIQQEKTYTIHGHEKCCFLHVCLGGEDNHLLAASTLKRLEKAITNTLNDAHPNDFFNALYLTAHLSEKEVHLLRTYAAYMQQIQYVYQQNFIAQTLAEFPHITQDLIHFFHKKFDPSVQNREKAMERYKHTILSDLESVESSEKDQLLRDMLQLMTATQRTNFYTNKPAIALKFLSTAIERLPDPKPLFDVFISSYLMEGIHLRSSKVARGGIRYSDRPQDFRNEILQLMQAQNLKNAIIVPTGAKGGFVIKKPNPSNEDVLEAYKTLITSLLDITDNRQGSGPIIQKESIIHYDGEDPYLVVAADKGTATFSDTANDLAQQNHFWLGDAFASGGSHGYDHKKLGITAKGAFVSVSHHGKALGIDITQTPLSVIGVGDMSGDVFGNGMILYPTLKLIGAFNHKHIFIDPEPDLLASFQERQRLFNHPPLGWDDYNPNILSKGGAIYRRSDKTLHLSQETQKLFNLPPEVSPTLLIRSLLKHSCDLLWFGGIGTYIKGSDENYHSDAANDAVRVNAIDVHARMIGEGANLGVTPLARIELGLKGVLINSDAIDNAGGVNCSDREVNLKILLQHLPLQKRDALLASVSHEIVDLILKDNQNQNETLDRMMLEAKEHHFDYCNLIQKLEREVGLKRSVVFLDKDPFLRNNRSFLTRSEMAVIMAYSKILLKKMILENFASFEKEASKAIRNYFPQTINQHFDKEIKHHLLYKEIASLALAKAMIHEKGILWLTIKKESSFLEPPHTSPTPPYEQ